MELDRIPTISDWMEYTAEKAKIQNIGLTPEQYEACIKAIVKRLGL